MNITEVRVKLLDKEQTRLKAIASMTIDGCFVIHEIKILEKEDGFIISMPNKKKSNGKFADVAHPINSETREQINNAIIEAYKKELANPTQE